MLLGTKYTVKAKAHLSNGKIIPFRVPVEAQFVTAEELIADVKREAEVKLGAKIIKLSAVSCREE